VREVLRAIAADLDLPVKFDTGVRLGERAGLVADELTGVASGTALAAVLRSRGLVLIPGHDTDGVHLLASPSGQSEEAWPAGREPPGPPREAAPQLLAYLTIEIVDHPLPDVVAAISQRLKMPILIDRLALRQQQIDPAAVRINVPRERTFYKKLLDKALFPARLRVELRVDDAGAPLLWITTIRRPTE
jgi:hypothetical protein